MKRETIQKFLRFGALACAAAFLAVGTPTVSTAGQAEAPAEERLDPYELITIELPGRIEIGPDGEAELVMVKWGPTSRMSIENQTDRRLWIEEIPIHRRAADGSLRVGLVFENAGEEPAETLRITQPALVVAEEDGSYRLEFAERSATVERAGRFPPGFARYAPGSDSAPVVYRKGDEAKRAAEMQSAFEKMSARTEDMVFDIESVNIRADRFVKTPAWVYIGEDRRNPILATAELGPLGPEDDDIADEILGRVVQIFTHLPNGDVYAGALHYNSTDKEVRGMNAFRPSEINMDRDGEFHMRIMHSSRGTMGMKNIQDPGYKPGYLSIIRSSRWVRVFRPDERTQLPREDRAPLNIILAYEDLPLGLEQEIMQAGNLAKSAIEQLIGNGGDVPILIDFSPQNPPVDYAGTVPEFGFVPYSLAADSLFFEALFESKSNAEIDMYQNLPLGTSIPVLVSDATFNISTVRLTAAQLEALGLMPPDFEFYATIFMNPDVMWQYNKFLGAMALGQSDFIGVLMHEICHALGFLTNMWGHNWDDAVPVTQAITVFDMFRFRREDVPPTGVSLFMVENTPRGLEQGVKAVAATLPSIPAATYRLSTGDFWDPNHWEHPDVLAKDGLPPVGGGGALMEVGAGIERLANLKLPDIRAMDIIGWHIDTNNLPVLPQDNDLLEPLDDEVGVSLTPTLKWSVAANAASYNVLIMSQGEAVFSASGVTQTMLDVPSGTLDSGMSYSWAVAAVNPSGVVQTPFWTFSTAGGPDCPGDVNGDGVVNAQDLAELLSCWGQIPMASPCESVDFNDDGVINAQDLSVVLGSWGECPE